MAVIHQNIDRLSLGPVKHITAADTSRVVLQPTASTWHEASDLDYSLKDRPYLQPRPPWQCGKQAVHLPTAPKVQDLKVWTLQSGQQCAGTWSHGIA